MCDEIGPELALEGKRRWPLLSPSTVDVESIPATHPLQRHPARARAVHLSARLAALWEPPRATGCQEKVYGCLTEPSCTNSF